MKVTFAHMCDYATISREGKLSVLGIFAAINAVTFPSTHPMLYIVFEIELSPAELNREVRARIELADADGGSLAKAESIFVVSGKAPPGERPRLPQVIQIANALFQSPGRYQWSIWLNDAHQIDIPFDINKVDAPQESPRLPPGLPE